MLPPGSRGNVAVPQLLQLGITRLPDVVATPGNPQGPLTTATPTTPTNFADQLEMYDALARTSPGQLSGADLTTYFKDARLGVDPADVVSTETPRPGVTVVRDRAGVPHITGATFEDVEYGAGWANVQDRMFLTDVLRHTGAARMAEFVGATPANIHMDSEQLRLAPYTVEQADAQIAAVVQRYGAEGEKMLRGVDAMLQGMNDAQAALCPLSVPLPLPGVVGAGFGVDCPVEYAALQKPPTPYTRADIVYIASLVGGIFGKGGGGEEANARWFQQLREQYGAVEARRIFDDLREKDDPEAPATSPVRQRYGGGGVAPGRPGVALPDLDPAATAPGSGDRLDAPPGPRATADPALGVVDGPFGPIDLGLRTHGMSNALLVDAAHSADGHPTVVFGPQTGYYTPQLLVEQDLRGPGIAARGVSFAGTNLVVELGHGADYAWSATSASNDIVDTIVERLCTTDGSAPTVRSTSYRVGSECRPMEAYVHTEETTPNATAPGEPQTLRFQVLKTRHGVVQGRTTVGGAPVAVVSQRTTYGHEVDSVIGFARLQDPDYVHDAASFQRAVSAIDYTFNWFYADDRDISYFSSGLLPQRRSGYDWDLPHWGDPAYDDVGTLPFSAHPRVTDPSRGYLVSWNNKTAPGFAAADNQWGYGAVYRSLALEDRLEAALSRGKITREGLVDVMEGAATEDVRASQLLPEVLAVVGTPSDPADAAAVATLRNWVRGGAQRVDRNRNGEYGYQAAVALLDAWWDPQGSGVGAGTPLPQAVLAGTLGGLVRELPKGLDDHPRQGLGSSWNGVAWYGYVDKDLRSVLGRRVSGPYSRTYCGGGSLARCRADLRASLHDAVQALLSQQGVGSVKDLTYDKGQDSIRSVTAGVVGVRPIDWQNRPTFQQVVRFDRHRPRG